MIVELRRQHPLRKRLLQLVEQTVLCEQLLWITASQQLVQNVLVDCHIDGPSCPSLCLPHRIPDTP
ncbi:hypothetical protein, partial [Sphingomonas sp. BE138]|uniref:hypothetical protein n=1 Tax=Sphingomonas sp. BE138 TaxID=2817845 RepID=UPI00286AD174